MKSFVVDVNVGIVANRKSPQANTACELACIQALSRVKNTTIAIDDRDRVLSEYRRHLSMSGQPGVGDEFIQWLHQNQCSPEICERVTITENPNRGFDEFPDDPALAKFDENDRKYVAVAIGSRRSPRILNAVDSDWRDHEQTLKKHGLLVEQLCPQCLKTN